MVRIYWLSFIDIALAIYRLAKGLKEPRRRGSRGYKLATRIAMLALVVLSGMSYDRALRLIKTLQEARGRESAEQVDDYEVEGIP